MPDEKKPKPIKPKIEELIEKQLDEPLLSGAKELIGFFKDEKVSLLWTSTNGYDLKHKGIKIGKIYFRDAKNRIELNIDTANWNEYDLFLKGQPKSVAELFIENMNGKCIQCRPHLNCAKGLGADFNVLGKTYKNVCVNSVRVHFLATGGNLQSMTLKRPNAIVGEPLLAQDYPVAVIKELIKARKKYVLENMSAKMQ